MPTSTVLQSRLMIYQPSQRPKRIDGEWMETSFGRVRVSGRLGQRHADLVECMMFCSEDSRHIDDGGFQLIVDPAKLRKAMSDGQYSHQRIEALLLDLKTAAIEIVTPEMEEKGGFIMGGLIDHVVPSKITRHDPLTKKDRCLWKVRLGVAMVKLVERDLALYYEPQPIARLKHGVSQAIARHVLSHKTQPKGGWHLDTLIRAVCGKDAKSSSMRNARLRFKEDLPRLKEVHISLDENHKVSRDDKPTP